MVYTYQKLKEAVLKMTNSYAKQAQIISEINAFRTLKTQAILNIMRKLDNATILRKYGINVQNSPKKKSDLYAYNYKKLHDKELDKLANNLNSYRINKLLKTLLNCQIDKKKLLEFSKPNDHVYTLQTSEVLQIADTHLDKIKRLIVIEYHNLKLQQFPQLNGLLHNINHNIYDFLRESIDDISHDTDIFYLHEETHENQKIIVGLMDKN